MHSADGGDCSTGGEQIAAAETVITLCVGGSQFTTTLGTLTAAPCSYFATLYGNPRWAPSVFLPGTQTPFIDRDPESFSYVLAYLRHLRYGGSQLVLPDSLGELKRLQAEADFYGLHGLAQACSLGKWASIGSSRQQHPISELWMPVQQKHQQQQPKSIFREPTFSLVQQQAGSSSGEATKDSCPNGALQMVADDQRPPQNAAPGAVNGAAASSHAATDVPPLSGDDVVISMQQSTPCLAQCVCTAQQLLAEQQQAWAADTLWQQLAELVLRHLLHLPLAAQQPDLVAALANPEPSTQLQFLLQYYPIGDLRIVVECRLVPEGTDATAVIAAAAAAGANAAVGSASSPHVSPRDARVVSRSASIGSATAGMVAAAAAAASAAAASRPGTPVTGEAAAPGGATGGPGVTPGPGWGGVTAYHRYSIREMPEKFVLTTHMPGEPQVVTEVPRSSFKLELHRYSALHKLLVQQAPRSSVAGLMWQLESAGFSRAKLTTLLDTYYVASNAFPGFKSVITLEL